MAEKFTSSKDKMLGRLEQVLPGSVLFAQDFSSDGAAEVVRQHLAHFTREGLLKRISHGVYVVPKKLGEHGDLLPTPEEIATALARRDKARILPTGEVAIWQLGLSTQVPLNYVYLTDGPSRVINVQNDKDSDQYSIRFKHASPKNFALRGKISGPLIQALRSMGQKSLTPEILSKIETWTIKENIDDLNHDLTIAPVWIAKLIRSYFKAYK